jgi:predicted DsbA family dithiol-disulfide isomerase
MATSALRVAVAASAAPGRDRAIPAAPAAPAPSNRRLVMPPVATSLPPVPFRDLPRLQRAVMLKLAVLHITLFTDPACPFAFSAEPVRQRLRWHYGDQLTWELRMIVLTAEPGEAEKLAGGAPDLQQRHGMPIEPSPYPRPASSEPACRAVVAARLNAPELEEPLLRRLRIRVMAGGLLDDPELLDGAARDVGLDPRRLGQWCASDTVHAALAADMAAARNPPPAARALDHKLGGPPEERRYTAPSYEIGSESATIVVPGFNPVEVYETAIANLAPELVRRAKPESVGALLAWAGEELATAEVAAVMQIRPQRARAALSRIARPRAAGADCYWSLP